MSVENPNEEAEANLLRALETVMKTNEARDMPSTSRSRVIQLLLYRYTEE